MPYPIDILLESLLLVTALSVDALAASFSYGAGGIRIPLRSVAVINLICSAMLALTLLAGSFVAPYIHPAVAAGIGFALLLVLGIVKLFDSTIKAFIKRHGDWGKEVRFRLSGLKFIVHIYASPEDADSDKSRVLSVPEAAALAVALSLDGLAVGFGAGLAGFHLWIVIPASLVIGSLAVVAGCALGNRAARLVKRDLSWVGGALLIALAFLRLI